mmetsp:Transcript_23847/g.66781  ORF Transcript_23847/g.66781 Transcript_23847/m.66781 type:complete len:99 (+) Transcript_23847:133-429(+)
MRSVRNTERVYNNETAQKVLQRERERPGDFSHILDLVRGENYRKSFHETGNRDDSVWSAGQVMGLIEDVPSCEHLLQRMVDEAATVIEDRLQPMVKSS